MIIENIFIFNIFIIVTCYSINILYGCMHTFWIKHSIYNVYAMSEYLMFLSLKIFLNNTILRIVLFKRSKIFVSQE